ncbi:uncharacterized protein RAG0_08447 [Rhynchosporium agropyri]|uniref:Uncharacterized protein n=1 Tax=Rhynchosporium agropyri TaxID=914238 RepID=A0A1E1KTY6_9HELO|nr:uncharacterized protein RAG0_08447 [Rhynchosporium agropyri]
MPFTSPFSSSEEKARRNSARKMSASNQPTMLAYRDENNTSIKYAPAPNTLQENTNSEDSENEALIQQELPSELSEHDQQHFTATGRPQPAFKPSGLANLGGHMFTVPQLLPKRYTDDSLIPAIIPDVIPAQKAEVSPETSGKEKKGLSLLNKFKSKKDETKDGKLLKVVYMPRRDYQKWFARDVKGIYVGSEEHRRWTEEELEETFGKYKPDTKEKKTGLFSGTGGEFDTMLDCDVEVWLTRSRYMNEACDVYDPVSQRL